MGSNQLQINKGEREDIEGGRDRGNRQKNETGMRGNK